MNESKPMNPSSLSSSLSSSPLVAKTSVESSTTTALSPHVSPQPTLAAPHLHDLHLLDTYLISILKDKSKTLQSTKTTKKSITKTHHQSIIHHILQVCEFLFSNSSSSSNTYSLLESALELLEDDANNASIPAVRSIRSSSSGRSMIVVRGSSSASASTSSCFPSSSTHTKKRRRKNYKDSSPSCSEYLITLGEDLGIHSNLNSTREYNTNNNTNNTNTEAPVTTNTTIPSNDDNNSILGGLLVGKIGYHCTCRSFYERMKRASNYDNDRFVICKHLLAAKIAPFLHSYETDGDDNDDDNDESGEEKGGRQGESGVSCYKEEEVEEEEFIKMYVNLSMGLWN
jgi:hypothetical protein